MHLSLYLKRGGKNLFLDCKAKILMTIELTQYKPFGPDEIWWAS